MLKRAAWPSRAGILCDQVVPSSRGDIFGSVSAHTLFGSALGFGSIVSIRRSGCVLGEGSMWMCLVRSTALSTE